MPASDGLSIHLMHHQFAIESLASRKATVKHLIKSTAVSCVPPNAVKFISLGELLFLAVRREPSGACFESIHRIACEIPLKNG